VVQDGRHIAGDEVFVFAQTDDSGRAVAGRDNFVGLVFGDDSNGEHPGQLLHGLADGFFQRDRAIGCREIFSMSARITSVSVSVRNLWPSSISFS